ncbi:MAG: hypothetical protein ACLQIB_25735 [Isosphaeraceae bacterium]
MVQLENLFPGLRDSGYIVTSPEDIRYNCVGWAAGHSDQWWWPAEDGYWPDEAEREETVAAFVAAFGVSGFVECDDSRLEAGYEKIAIYASIDGTPTHVAKQLDSGLWSSKLGQLHDIQHRLQDLAGTLYGTVARFLQRERPCPD